MANRLKRKRVAVATADFVERDELVEPRKVLEAEGATTDLSSLEPGRIQAVNHDEVADTDEADRLIGELMRPNPSGS